ncbi:GYF domain-containing protein [Pseudoxanthomonas sacheonensis]|uniref:GYF domain-containing protein n=1 Tax=Pseudoxanthomonas sacheonensis TaxID=443615 RepID=UPI0013D19E93|nr:GYF domain-containing protein [Pseudoxanthomonas sacheonensis]KAF1710808.1 pilus assembly protein PilA [Pseudoxanthomonas sacheonensis]
MSEWYYSAGADQRQGPLDTDGLIALFRQGRIGLDTLVWRDGQAKWQPLGDFAAELGFAGGTLPPPLPPRPVSMPQPVSAPPKSGMSGCMIAIIVAAVLAIPMVGILAAIALPAYNDYTLRAKVASALPVAEPAKAALVAHLTSEQTCPNNEEAGFGTPESYASGTVASISFGQFESDLCGMELILTVPGKEALDGKAVWLEYDPSDSSWQCSSEIDDKLLPIKCRG